MSPIQGCKRQPYEQSVVPEIANKRQYARIDDEKLKIKLKFLNYNFQRMCAKNQLNTHFKNYLKSCTEDVRTKLLKQIYKDCVNLSNGSSDVTKKMYEQITSEPIVLLDRVPVKKFVPVTKKKRKLEKKEITKPKRIKHFCPLLENLFGPEHLYSDEILLNEHDNCPSVKLTNENTSPNKNKRSFLSKRSTLLDPLNKTVDLLSDLLNDPTDDEVITANKTVKVKQHTLQLNKQDKVQREHNKLCKKERFSTSTMLLKSSTEQAENTLTNVKRSKSPEVFVVNKNKHSNDKANPSESTAENKPQVFSRVITSMVGLQKRHKQNDVVNNIIGFSNKVEVVNETLYSKRGVKEEKCGEALKICLKRTTGNEYTIHQNGIFKNLDKPLSAVEKNMSSPDSGISVSYDSPMPVRFGSMSELISNQTMEKINEMEVVVNSDLVLEIEPLINFLAGLLQEEDVLYSGRFVPDLYVGAPINPSTTKETTKSNLVCKSIAKLIQEFNGKKHNMIYLSSCLIRVFHKIIQDRDFDLDIIRDRFKMFCGTITKFVKSINKPFATRWLHNKRYIVFLEICDYIILDEKSMISQLRFQKEKFKITHYINSAFKYFENASVGCYDIDVSSINVKLDCSSQSDDDSSSTNDKKPSFPAISVRPEFGIRNFAVENHNVLSTVLHLVPEINSVQPDDNKPLVSTSYYRCMEFASCKKLSEYECMCKKATYCSQKCQANHWHSIHKNECSLRTTIT